MKGCAVLLVLCLWLSTGSSNLLNLANAPTEKTPEDVVERWHELDKKLKGMIESVIQQALPMVVRSSSEVEMSQDCTAALFKLMLGVRQFKGWAISMMDAMGKFPSGIMTGTASDLGAYDQCLDIRVADDFRPEEELFRGQYCAVEVKPPLPRKSNIFYRMDEMLYPLQNVTVANPALEILRHQAQMFYFISFRIGACVPSSCSKDDVAAILTLISKMVGANINVTRCEVREPVVLQKDQIAVLCVVGALAILCLLGTTVDVLATKFYPDDKGKSYTRRIINAFSVPRNTRNLLNTSTSNSESSVNVLHGLKFLSITWIIMGHTYLYLNWQLLRNQTKSRSYIKDLAFQAIVNAFVSVDSFFFASGFLISYLTILHVDRKGAFNIPLFFFRRLWRFWPATGMLVGLTVLLPFAGSGPLFHESVDILVDACRKNWWANMAFVNNFFFSPDACQPTTWYTACDVQLYMFSVMFLLLVIKKPKWSLPFAGFLILGSVLSASIVNYWQDLPPALLMISPDPESIFTYWYYSHFLPHVHLGSYAIGLALGYVIVRHKDVKLSKLIVVSGWVCAAACNLTVLYSTYIWNSLRPPTTIESTIYSGLHRPAWIAGVAWMVYACVTGNGGVVNSILSWPGFIPLSKLTFLAYLWHGTIIWVYMGNQEASIETNHLVVVWMFMGHLVATYILSFVFHILYEAPFIQLDKIFLGGGARKSTKSSEPPISATVQPAVDMTEHRNRKTFPVNGNGVYNHEYACPANGNAKQHEPYTVRL